MRANAKNITALFVCLCFFVGFFWSSEYKSIKLGINPDDTKYLNIYMETSHIHIDQ